MVQRFLVDQWHGYRYQENDVNVAMLANSIYIVSCTAQTAFFFLACIKKKVVPWHS